jgi:TubC N-terminal docking domain
MGPEAIIAVCMDRGITLSVDSGQLRYQGPPGATTLNLLRLLKAHKPELIALLQTDSGPESGKFPGFEGDSPKSARQSGSNDEAKLSHSVSNCYGESNQSDSAHFPDFPDLRTNNNTRTEGFNLRRGSRRGGE